MSETTIKLSYNADRGQYRKCIGHHVTGGTRKPRHFWLGPDEDRAKHVVLVLGEYHRTHLEPNDLPWTPEHERRAMLIVHVQRQIFGLASSEAAAAAADSFAAAERAAADAAAPLRPLIDAGWGTLPAGLPERLLPPPGPDAVTVQVTRADDDGPATPDRPAAGGRSVTAGWTWDQACRRTLDTLRARGAGDTYVRRAEAAVKQLQEQLPPDTALRDLTHDVLLKTVAYFTARPPSKITGRPLAIDSLKTLMQFLKNILEVAEDLGWQSAGWRRLFRVRWGALRTPAEQRQLAGGKATFTDAELKRLYDVANPRQRMLLVLALNTAMHQREIATLLADDVHLDDDPPVISRIRNKTRASSATAVTWTLWPETVEALRRERAPADNALGLFLTTANGQALVHGTTDTIMLTWSRLIDACNRERQTVRSLPFGTLRKTASTWVRNHAGEPVQELMLAHAGRSVARRHYTGQVDFAPLHAALDAYRHHLVAARVLPTPAGTIRRRPRRRR